MKHGLNGSANVICEVMDLREGCLPPEISVNCKYYLSFRENLKISLKTHTQDERVSDFPVKFVTREVRVKCF